MSPIEAMARAFVQNIKLQAKTQINVYCPGEIEETSDLRRLFLDGDIDVVEAVTAALLALSQMYPTPGMVEAGLKYVGDHQRLQWFWEDMLAAAVKEG